MIDNSDIRPWVSIAEAAESALPPKNLADLIRSDGSICSHCAKANGAIWPKGHAATHWVGKCNVCGNETGCCAVSDWAWPRHSGKKAPREF